MKALLVDDSKAARFAMSKLLRDQGLEVETAASGEEALDKIATDEFQIVFMDQSMPGMGGIAATRAITSNEKTAHIPVVLCTGNEGDKLEQMAKEAGAIGVLTKPPQEEALKEVLGSLQPAEATAEVEEAAPAEAVAPAAAPVVDTAALMAEVEALVAPLRESLEQLAGKNKKLETRITAVMQSTERQLQPLKEAVQSLDQLDQRIGEQVKEQLAVDANNQRIQLETLRQQVNASLDEMESREEKLRQLLGEEIRDQMMPLVDRKLEPLRDAMGLLRQENEERLAEMENRIAAMEKGLLLKSALIAILAAAAAFGAAFALLGG